MFAGGVEDAVAKVKPVDGRPMTFRTEGLGRPRDVTLSPFYRVRRQRYAIYWKLAGPSPGAAAPGSGGGERS